MLKRSKFYFTTGLLRAFKMGTFPMTPKGLWVFQSSLTIQPLHFRARKYTLETQPEFPGSLGAWKDGAMTQGRRWCVLLSQRKGRSSSSPGPSRARGLLPQRPTGFSQSHFTLNLPSLLETQGSAGVQGFPEEKLGLSLSHLSL